MTDEPMVNDTVYEWFRRTVEYILPGFGTFYFTMGEIWNLPMTEEVVGTCAAVATFLGVFVHISRRQYKNSNARFDGELVVDESHPERDVYSFEVDGEVGKIAEKDEIALKVRHGKALAR